MEGPPIRSLFYINDIRIRYTLPKYDKWRVQWQAAPN
jgi:hypothetical protein